MMPDIHLMVDKYAVIEVSLSISGMNFSILGKTLFTTANRDLAIEQCMRFIGAGVICKVYERCD